MGVECWPPALRHLRSSAERVEFDSGQWRAELLQGTARGQAAEIERYEPGWSDEIDHDDFVKPGIVAHFKEDESSAFAASPGSRHRCC